MQKSNKTWIRQVLQNVDWQYNWHTLVTLGIFLWRGVGGGRGVFLSLELFKKLNFKSLFLSLLFLKLNYCSQLTSVLQKEV